MTASGVRGPGSRTRFVGATPVSPVAPRDALPVVRELGREDHGDGAGGRLPPADALEGAPRRLVAERRGAADVADVRRELAPRRALALARGVGRDHRHEDVRARALALRREAMAR